MSSVPYDLGHLIFSCGAMGRMMTLDCIPVLAGDRLALDYVGSFRLSPLRRGLAIDCKVDIMSFYIPHRYSYTDSTTGDWTKFVEEGVGTTEVLKTTDYIPDDSSNAGALGLNYYTFSGQRDVPRWIPAGYRNIWNNYIRPPTTTSVEKRAFQSWADSERRYGLPTARLKRLWSTVLPVSEFDQAKLKVPVASGTADLDLIDLQYQYAKLRTEQEREYFNIRYRDIVRSFGGFTNHNVDNRPHLLYRSSFWSSGYDVDGTSKDALGQFSGRVLQAFRHRVPRYKCSEAGSVWTVAIARFPSSNTQENHFLARRIEPTYAEIVGDPVIVGNQRLYPLAADDIFSTNLKTELGKVPYAQWYRYHPDVIHPNYRTLQGFPFLQDPVTSQTNAVLERAASYDQCFSTLQLGHWNIQARSNAHVIRNLPSSRSSMLTTPSMD